MSYDVLEASSEREEDLIYGSDEQLSSILLPAILSRDYTNSSPEERHLFWFLYSEKSLMMKCCMFSYSWGRVKHPSNIPSWDSFYHLVLHQLFSELNFLNKIYSVTYNTNRISFIETNLYNKEKKIEITTKHINIKYHVDYYYLSYLEFCSSQ